MKSSSLEVYSKTGAVLSITWNRDGDSGPLSPGPAKLRRFSIEYLFSEVPGSPTEVGEKYPGFTSRFIKPVGMTCAGTI